MGPMIKDDVDRGLRELELKKIEASSKEVRTFGSPRSKIRPKLENKRR